MVTENGLNMRPPQIKVDTVTPFRDGTVEILARASGRNGFSPKDVVMQISTHDNILGNWDESWTGLYTVGMNYVKQDSDGTYLYKARFYPGPGKHEAVVVGSRLQQGIHLALESCTSRQFG
jgi:hypothetical protein